MNKPLKLAFMIDDLHIGGAEKLIIEMLNHLDPKQWEILLITLKQKGNLFKEIPPATHIKTFCTSNPLKLYKFLKKENPQILHTHLWKSDFIGILTGSLAKIKTIICTKHNVKYFRGIKRILIPLDAFLLKRCRKVICISNAVKNHYQAFNYYKTVPFQVIHNGIKPSPFKELMQHKNTTPHSTYNILTIANLIPQKGHTQFLKILKLINDIDFEWHIVGDGHLRNKIKNEAHKLSLEKKIIFHGPQKNILQFYEKADIFLLPSIWEGFGLVLLEAMTAGVPIFASSVDGITEIIENNKTAILFSWKDSPQTIATKLKNLMLNTKLQEELKNHAHQKSHDFTIKKMHDAYIQCYLSAISSIS